MFAKVAAFATLLSVVAAQAPSIVLETPQGWTSGVQANISWSTSDTNIRFSLELVNPTNFHNSFGIATNVDPTSMFSSFTLPIVPAGDGYILQAINVTDINTVYGSTGDFSIAATPSSVSSSSSTVSGSSTVSSLSITSSGSGSASATSAGSSASNSAPPASSGASTGAASPSNTPFNGAPAGLELGLASWAVMAVGAVAGAVVAL